MRRIRDHWEKISDPVAPSRFGHTARRAATILGAPDDRAVRNVGGRLGAGQGPLHVRRILSGFYLGLNGALESLEIHEGSDSVRGGTIEEGHHSLRALVSESLRRGITPIVVGGGHDYGYPHFGGVVDALGEGVALINVDAHLDVRPPDAVGITSGSPFYLALESGLLSPKRFVEFGIQDHCNDSTLGEYVKKKRVRVVPLADALASPGPVAKLLQWIDRLSADGSDVVVSFDVDSVAQACAPGVSAPQSAGFTAHEFTEMARIAGLHPHVASVGFFEYAPFLDEGERTGRLVATAVHRFMTGLSERKPEPVTKKGKRVAIRGVKRLLNR